MPQPEGTDRIEELIGRAERAEGVAARRYAIEQAAQGMMLADPGSVPAGLRARARALGMEEAVVASTEEQPPPHAARVPLVDRDRDEAFVRMLWIEFDPTGLAPERPALGPTARAAIADALARAAEIAAPPRARDRFRLVAARPAALDRAAIDGESIAAAALASAVSLWSERPLRARVAITGRVLGGAIAPVGAIAEKARAALEAGCEAIVVPAEQIGSVPPGIRALGVRTIEELLAAVLGEGGATRDPELAAREAYAAAAEGWRGYLWPSIAERLARVAGSLPEGRPDLQVEVLARLAAARRHLGDPEGSLAVIASAEAIARARADAIPDAPLTRLAQQRAMTSLKLFRFADARRASRSALAIARRARLRGDVIKALGCVGIVALGEAELDRACAAFEEGLALTLAHAPTESARSRVYLLDALGRAGRAGEARAQWEAAMREVEQGDARARRKKESWVRTGWGGALVAMGCFEEAIEVLDVAAVHESLHDDPLPGLHARRHLGLALVHAAPGPRDRGLQLLAASPLAHGRALEPGLRSLAQVNVLVEGTARIAVDRWDADAAARVASALASLPTYGDAPRWLGPSRARAERSLDRGGPRLGSALAALVARCDAI